MACVKYFEGKFPKVQGGGVGIHPNRYFSSAMKAMKNINEKAKMNENIKDDNNDRDIEETVK